MPATTLPQTGANELVVAQSAAETAANEVFRHLDAGHTRSIIEDRDLTSPPGSCSDGARYLVATSGSGLWSGQTGKLAIAFGTNASNGWLFETVAVEGFKLYVRDENVELLYNGSAWVTTATGGAATESFVLAPSDETTALTTGTAKLTFRMPYAFTLTAVRASLSTAQTSGSIFTVDINEAGTSVLSTKLTIDNGEKTSTTAATAAVISDGSIADDAEITIDIDQVGDGTAKGLKVVLIGHQ